MWNFLTVLVILFYTLIVTMITWISLIGIIIIGALVFLMGASAYFVIFKPIQWCFYKVKQHCHWRKYNRPNK
jgi:hypothetical protein